MATGAIELHESGEYRNLAPLNLYDSPQRDSLATQAATGRYLRILSLPHGDESSLRVRLCEDDYPGWLAPEAVVQLEPVPSSSPYVAVEFSEMEIRDIIPEVIEFTKQAMAQPNHYLWGGTLGPNYDCSGLMQAAFASVGVWLPRDAYLQEAFTLAVSTEAMQPGDLVFFRTPPSKPPTWDYIWEAIAISIVPVESWVIMALPLTASPTMGVKLVVTIAGSCGVRAELSTVITQGICCRCNRTEVHKVPTIK